ncbi:hypothetical protein CEP52_007900 [Fusarium oligoseptatum]|uniref:Ubiquitin-like domain-containing protein n=1 Tax=Fusarium oligoseptatum TaxID=2604345 RepID=A0A428TKP5_9HYPO|nr:hypothetical protein CEP52_007900 [Fusarium oligoseptatum]
MSFGYSVGDVIAGANLTYRLIRIMADTRGGSVEFLEAMSELSAMQQAFFQVGNIRSHEMLPAATVNAASHIVLSSMDIIAKFLERSKHYQRILGDSRASSTFESSWCKVGWTLYKSHELRDLRDTLHAKLALVQVLLSTASYCAPMAQHQVGDENAVSSSPEPEREPLRFKDAVGRKFSFPFHLCNTWQGMEELIKQAFIQVDVLGPHVMDGHYDLLGPDALKTMSIDSFEDAISTLQAQMSCGGGNLSRDSSLENTEGQASFGDVVGNDKEHEREIEEDSGISIDGQDHESIAPTSDSEDWEDYSEDEEASAGDKDSGF